MKKMHYNYNPDSFSQRREILAEGKIGGYEYIIMSHSIYPAIYINLPNESLFTRYINDLVALSALKRELSVHGGIQYFCNILDTGEQWFRTGHFIGWLYNTETDYIAGEWFKEHHDMKKWTTGELIGEAEQAIDELMNFEVRSCAS